MSAPLTTKTVIWQSRLVKMLDAHNWAMSRMNDYADFDFAPMCVDREMAVSGNYECIPVLDIEIVDENCLRFKTHTGAYLLHGNPVDNGRIEWETRTKE